MLITTRTHVSPRENKEANLFRKEDGESKFFVAIVHKIQQQQCCLCILVSYVLLLSLYILTCSGSRGPWSMCYATHNVLLCSGSRYNAIFTLRHGQGKNAVHS